MGQVVLSAAGHDKDRFYMVVKYDDYGVYIADGKRRKLAKPKRKNRKHLKKTNMVLAPDAIETDKMLRQALAVFNNRNPARNPEKREE